MMDAPDKRKVAQPLERAGRPMAVNRRAAKGTVSGRPLAVVTGATVGIGYEVPWRQVEEMLKMAADRTAGLLKEPPPFVLQQGLADFAVNYEINAFCHDEKRSMQIYTELHRNIQDVFNEHEVQIMTPNYVADTPDAKIVPQDQWFAAPAKPPGQSPNRSSDQ